MASMTRSTVSEFGPEDVGKAVRTADGVPIATITTVQDGDAYIQPRAGLFERYGSLLSSCWRRDQTFRLQNDLILEADEDEFRLEVSVGELATNISG